MLQKRLAVEKVDYVNVLLVMIKNWLCHLSGAFCAEYELV